MIQDKDTASKINDLMIEFSKRLNESALMVQSVCPDSEFQNYRRATGQIMDRMFTDIMRPIYKEHPDLKPEELK